MCVCVCESLNNAQLNCLFSHLRSNNMNINFNSIFILVTHKPRGLFLMSCEELTQLLLAALSRPVSIFFGADFKWQRAERDGQTETEADRVMAHAEAHLQPDY